MKEMVFLIGFRGTGKTTVGKLLARKLGYAFIDTDQCICRKKGTSVKTIVDREGWEGFRRCEAEVLTECGNTGRTVVATGGGAVLHRQFWQGIGKNAVIVWLTAGSEILLERICRDSSTMDNRPSLTGKEVGQEILEVLREREPMYREFADFTVDTGKLKVMEAVDFICKNLTKI
jgi:shikimate kinase